MWCMLNSPLMLGMDLRRVEKGDSIYNIITNTDLIALDQDPLGIQAKRIFTTAECTTPDKDYIRDTKRIDVLAKPLSNGDIALAFFNIENADKEQSVSVNADNIVKAIGHKMVNANAFAKASSYQIRDLISKDETTVSSKSFGIDSIKACDSKVIRITPIA